MKKLTLLLAIAIMLFACKKDEDDPTPGNGTGGTGTGDTASLYTVGIIGDFDFPYFQISVERDSTGQVFKKIYNNYDSIGIPSQENILPIDTIIEAKIGEQIKLFATTAVDTDKNIDLYILNSVGDTIDKKESQIGFGTKNVILFHRLQ